MKSSGAYQQAMSRATQEPAVIGALGQPITTGYLITGEITTSEDTGMARLVIPLQGPKGGASLYMRASKRDGSWTFSLLTVDVPSAHQRLDPLLLPPQSNARIPSSR